MSRAPCATEGDVALTEWGPRRRRFADASNVAAGRPRRRFAPTDRARGIASDAPRDGIGFRYVNVAFTNYEFVFKYSLLTISLSVLAWWVPPRRRAATPLRRCTAFEQ